MGIIVEVFVMVVMMVDSMFMIWLYVIVILLFVVLCVLGSIFGVYVYSVL